MGRAGLSVTVAISCPARSAGRRPGGRAGRGAAHHTQHSEHGHLLAAAAELLDVEGKDGDQVDHVHRGEDERAARADVHREAADVLDSEDADDDDLDDAEPGPRVGVLEARHRGDHERDRGDDDRHHHHVGDDHREGRVARLIERLVDRFPVRQLPTTRSSVAPERGLREQRLRRHREFAAGRAVGDDTLQCLSQALDEHAVQLPGQPSGGVVAADKMCGRDLVTG